MTVDIDRELHERFGFAEFRPGQREAVEAVLEGRDVLAIMPTGSGKSLCYQLPALVGAGLTRGRLAADRADAGSVRGARRDRGVRRRRDDGVEHVARRSLADPRRGSAAARPGCVYVAPERFSSRPSCDALAATRRRRGSRSTRRTACREWGHDFRPDYRRLADVRERLGSPPTIALTATATQRVARRHRPALGLRDPATPSPASTGPTSSSR